MSQFFAQGGQSIGVSTSASVLPIQDRFPLGLIGLISFQSKELSRVLSNTTVQKHQFFGAQLFFILQLSHSYMTTRKTIALSIWTFVDKVMSLLFNMLSGGGNEDNGDLPQKIPCMYCYTQCPQPCSWLPPTHPPPETPRHPQASPGQSPVGSLLFSPGSWCTRFCCALRESISQSCVSSGSSMVG